MSIKMQITAPRLDQASKALAQYPEIADKYHRVALRAAVNQIADLVKPLTPELTGTAREEFATRVAMENMSTSQDKSFGAENTTGFGTQFLVGRVGWFGKVKSWYIRIVEAGAKPHTISDPEKSHVKIGGEWRSMSEHPGFAARKFFISKENQAKEIAQAEIEKAGQLILAALAKAGSS